MERVLKLFFLFLLLLFIFLPFFSLYHAIKLGRGAEVRRAIPIPYVVPKIQKELKKHGFHDQLRVTLQKGFNDPRFIDSVFNDPRLGLDSLILFPPRVVPRWKGYSFLFTEESIERGRSFLSKNKKELKRVDSVFSVPPSVVVAILKVETDIGHFLGKYYVPNVFYTKYYINRKRGRSVFHLVKQFRIFLELSQKNNWDPLQIKGSWAGAFGWCQFMPFSDKYYAIDWNGDGVVNLFEKEDAMASIANYLFENGWYKKSKPRQLKSLWRYNRSNTYARAVYEYALIISDNKKSHIF